MKKIICVNSKLYKCENCIKKENCLYYFLSGEDFKGFPAIIVNRQLLEKKKYNKNESLELSFYLIGTATQYVDFISEYLDTTNKLWNNFFQKRLMKVEYLDDTELYNG